MKTLSLLALLLSCGPVMCQSVYELESSRDENKIIAGQEHVFVFSRKEIYKDCTREIGCVEDGINSHTSKAHYLFVRAPKQPLKNKTYDELLEHQNKILESILKEAQ